MWAMAGKINTLSLRTGEDEPILKQFEIIDENNPDQIIKIGFKRLDSLDGPAVQMKSFELVERFVDGKEEQKWNESKKQMETFKFPPETIPPLNGEPIMVTAGTCQVVAMLITAQDGHDPSMKYTPVEWFHILACRGFRKALLKVIADWIAGKYLDDVSWLDEPENPKDPLAEAEEETQDS